MQSPHRHRAFTLLEVILSLALSLVLMAALYTALKLHIKIAQKGPETVHQAQSARAILDLIARDIRATVSQAPPQPASSSSSSSGAAASSPASSTTSSSSTSSGDTSSSGSSQAQVATFGMFGGSDWIELYIVRLRADLDDADYEASSGSIGAAVNVLRVSYSLQRLTAPGDKKGHTQRIGLARTQLPASGVDRFDTGSSQTDFEAASDFLSDDIGKLQFQYWDDSSGGWTDSWGTDMPIAPPRAVKVFVSLLNPDDFNASELGLTGISSTWTPNYQMVIPIAGWAPADSSSSSSTTTGGGS